MKSFGIYLSIFLLVVSLRAQTCGQNTSDATGLLTIAKYFELLTTGNYEIASDMWTPESLERSSRFGIRYLNIPLKADCASPIVRDLSLFDAQMRAPIKNYKALGERGWTRLEFSQLTGSRNIEHDYYAQKRGDWFWLGYPQDYYGGDWPVVESRYFRIHVHPEVQRFINDVVLDKADEYVKNLAETLGIDGDMLKVIKRGKIEYFFCKNNSLIKRVSGGRAEGTLDLGSNDIISTSFPHFHEIAHLMVNIRLQELPLFTLPLMREGTAVRFGGRWGRNAAALIDLGIFLHREELVMLDSILTSKGFESESGADIVYPVAGLFNAFLMDNMTIERYLELYLALSGSMTEVSAMSAVEIQNVIIGATGHPAWIALKTDFDSYLKDYVVNTSVALPGSIEGGKIILKGEDFLVKEKDEWLAFEFDASSESNSGKPTGNLLFAQLDDLEGQTSALFFQQYGDSVAYHGFRFGVRFDPNEAGLYDYATNQLLAKYIWGISPSGDYYDADRQRVCIKFRKFLVEKKKPSRDSYFRLAN